MYYKYDIMKNHQLSEIAILRSIAMDTPVNSYCRKSARRM